MPVTPGYNPHVPERLAIQLQDQFQDANDIDRTVGSARPLVRLNPGATALREGRADLRGLAHAGFGPSPDAIRS